MILIWYLNLGLNLRLKAADLLLKLNYSLRLDLDDLVRFYQVLLARLKSILELLHLFELLEVALNLLYIVIKALIEITWCSTRIDECVLLKRFGSFFEILEF